jgi:hypothetical protein
MSTSAIVGPGLLIGTFALVIVIGLVISLVENRLNTKRDH